jgi:hypothetical protein
MPRFLRTIANCIEQKDTAPVNTFESFTAICAVVVRDHRGAVKAEIPNKDEKGFGSNAPLAIYKPTGANRKFLPTGAAVGMT